MNKGMKKAVWFCSIMMAVLLIQLPVHAQESGKIVILHTNDVHCQVDQKKDAGGNITNEGYAAVAAYKKAMQAQYGAGNVTLVDAGDAIQGGSIGLLSQGAWLTDIMNITGYDIAVPGNHEFDYGFDQFMKLTQKAQFPYVCANLTRTADGQKVFPAYVMKSYGNVQVAYVGITTPESFTSSTPKYFQDAAGNYIYSFAEDSSGEKLCAAVQSAVDQARAAGADYVVAIGHLGEEGVTPRWKASAVIAGTTGINILIDGHSHQQFEDQLYNKNGEKVFRAQTGTKLAAIGKIVIDIASGAVSQELVTGCAGQDPDVAAYIAGIENQYKAALDVQIGTTAQTMTIKDPATGNRLVRNGETNLGDYCADAFREVLGTDIGLINGGGIRAELETGVITRGDILDVFPFGNRSCVISVTGQQILDALEFSVRKYPSENGGFLQVSGMTFTLDPSVPSSVQVNDKGEFVSVTGMRRISNVQIGSQPVKADQRYTIGGISYTLINGGDGYSMFRDAAVVAQDGTWDYEVLMDELQKTSGGKIPASYANPYGAGRITVKGGAAAAAASALPAASAAQTYTVQKGDNLWKIAKTVYGDGNQWVILYQQNSSILKDQNLLYAGQQLKVSAGS